MKVELVIEWQAESGVCVGSTADVQGLGVDKATARDDRGRLVIPGSTLKGRLRFGCRRIAGALGEWVCEGSRAERMCPVAHEQGSFCVVCETFGSPWRRCRLVFGDARLVTPLPAGSGEGVVAGGRRLDTEIRAGVSISRSRRAAYGERLFRLEASLPNLSLVYRADVLGEVAGPKQLALLLAGVRTLRMAGGGRSRGLGWGRTVRVVLNGEGLDDPALTRLLEEGGYA
jgi:CRISPR/Cas system CSM-associated protein Csm3 (group 7 of RAMP superfamily)